VWFGIHAVARPRDLVVWLAFPWLLRLQRRFVREAPEAIRRGVDRRLAARESAQDK
jgi:hypothetical protein